MRPSRMEREQKICRLVRARTFSVAALAEEFRCSEATIRRDLAGLKKAGKLLRVHGGAVANDRLVYEASFEDKLKRRIREKEAIAAAASGLVKRGDVVFLDTGTTTLCVARQLRAVEPSVIVTVNLLIALEYVGQREVNVILPGGAVGQRSPDIFGEITLETLKDLACDVAFFGCDSANLEDGFCTPNVGSAAVSRLMLSRSKRAYLVADSSKFGWRSMCRIAALDRLAGVVTDSGVSPEFRAALEQRGVEVIVAETQDSSVCQGAAS